MIGSLGLALASLASFGSLAFLVSLASLPWVPQLATQDGAGVASQDNAPALKLLVAPDSVLMAAMTVGSPHWIGASAALLAGGEDHFHVWNLEGPWNTARGRRLRAIAELACNGAPAMTMPLTALAQIQGGQGLDFWSVTDPTILRRIPPSILSLVRDDRGIPSLKEDDQETEAYWETLLLAAQTDGKAISAAVRQDLTRADLMNQPAKNRGQVVRLAGRLVRLRKIEPAAIAAQAGIPVIYEAWIITEAYGANPACALVIDLPPGIAPAETIDEQVEVDGFFFKRYRYQSAGPGPDGTPYRKAPLIIGRQLRMVSPPIDSLADRLWVSRLLPWLLVIVLGSGALVAALTFWLHRGDEKVRRKVRELRGARIAQFLESGAEWPEPPIVLSNQENDQRTKRWTTPSEN